ncbi:DUF7677 family protein [Dactylosporangium sp. CA-152071]|uniref:DUF7677 family protein n=1 Tax=Dactylosporangium sp. CA-152071 TaxID=3239933 RepID=UPI003D8F681D
MISCAHAFPCRAHGINPLTSTYTPSGDFTCPRTAERGHLRPSYLRAYLSGSQLGRIHIERLAQLSGRHLANLQRALITTPIPRPRAVLSGQPSPAERAKQRAEARAELFAAIRADHRREDISVRALSARYQVHRRTVRQALASAVPPPRKRQAPRARTLRNDTQEFIDGIIRQDLQVPSRRRHSVRQIWERLLDDHDITVSYSTVRDYVVRRRAELADTAPSQPHRDLPSADPARRLPDNVRSAIHYFAMRLTNGTLSPRLLNGIDYRPYLTDPGSELEMTFAIFTNVLDIDANGLVTNTDAAHHRAAQWIRARHDPSYRIDPPLQAWETELT